MSTLSDLITTDVLARMAPSLNACWRGEWTTGTVEPWRLLYDHELIVFQQGHCRVMVGDMPADPGPLPRDADGQPSWYAVRGPKAQALITPTTGVTYECTAGSFLIIPPDTPHLTVVEQGPAIRACIHFDWLAQSGPAAPICTVPPTRPVADLIKRAPSWVPSGVIQGEVRLPRRVNDLLEALFQRWQTKRSDERCAARATMLELLVRLLSEPDTASLTTTQELAQAVKDLLDRHLCDLRTLPEMLTELGRSYEHCCRVFAATYGVPPLRYVTTARLEHAKYLLRQPHPDIAQIARRVGYVDVAYFNRLFAKEVGVTPKAFIAS